MMEHNQVFQRLPSNIVPDNYFLYLKPDFNNFTFEGRAIIRVLVKEETQSMVFNALDLSFKSIDFQEEYGNLKKPIDINVSSEKETVVLTFDSLLSVGTGFLEILYVGQLNDQLNGFYRSKTDVSEGTNEEKYCVATHFEATYARKAFPCWDEPSFKASFHVSLIVKMNQTALSNMSVTCSLPDDPEPGWKYVIFRPTERMSTYLVAFVVGKFDHVETFNDDGQFMRVYVPPGKKHQGEFALELLYKSMSFYEDYFGIRYPLEKLDLIAIPDFGCGAMENWGLITFKESCLLVDSNSTSFSTKQRVALVICHELAHMWFGNLVTMEWWSDLWLKEGFANFMEFMCVDFVHPEFDVWSCFWTTVYSMALELDSLDSSHPIEAEVGHPSEANELFDLITYDKGASIIRMLHKYLGDSAFRKGIHHYLTKYSFGNATTKDLWDSLHSVSSLPVVKVMDSFTKQKGFPVINATIEKINDSEQVLKLSQSKFFTENRDKDGSLWSIPLNITSGKNSTMVIKHGEMCEEHLSVKLEDLSENFWVKLNPSCVDYYRVQYSSGMLWKFLPAIQDLSLPPNDRLDIQNDHFALVMNGSARTVDSLKLIEAFVNENNYTVWTSISQCLKKLLCLLGDTDAYPPLCNFGRKLFSKIFESLGWDSKPSESNITTLLRSTVLEFLVICKDESVLNEALENFQAHVNGSQLLPPDLRKIVYLAVTMKGSHHTLDQLIEMYKKADSQEEKRRIGECMGAFDDVSCLQKVIDFSMTDHVRTHDMVVVFLSVCHSEKGRMLAWNFFKKNIAFFKQRYNPGMLLSHFISGLTKGFKTEEMYSEIQEFFKAVNFLGTEQPVRQALEQILINQRWMKKEAFVTTQWLQENYCDN